MKKLIALTLSLAIILCFSFAVMAAPVTLTNNGTAGSDNNGTQSMVTTFDADTMTFVTTVTGVTDQATLLAFSGDTLTTTGETNIEFIDQISIGTTQQFTYKLKTDPVANATYTIKVGGSNLATPLSQFVTPIVGASGYTISGTVSNAADLNIIGDEALDAIYNAAWKTVVTLKASVYAETFIAETVVDGAAKTFSFANVANGTYVLSIIRDGYLPREMEITVAGENINLGDKPLLGGDLYGPDLTVYTDITTDLFIDGADLGVLVANLGIDYENLDYLAKYDIYPDLFVDGADLGTLVSNLGNDYSAYGETISY
jgi:hypothetical protein